MIISFLLVTIWTMQWGIIGEDRETRQFVVVGNSCICTDAGVCECKNGECQCADCPKTPVKTLVKMPAKVRKMITKKVFDGYVYQRVCTSNGCQMQRIPHYVWITVEE